MLLMFSVVTNSTEYIVIPVLNIYLYETVFYINNILFLPVIVLLT